MVRDYCIHMMPLDGVETCIDCDWEHRQWEIQTGGIVEVNFVLAWQAVCTWLNGTSWEWYQKGYDDGYEDHRANTRDH